MAESIAKFLKDKESFILKEQNDRTKVYCCDDWELLIRSYNNFDTSDLSDWTILLSSPLIPEISVYIIPKNSTVLYQLQSGTYSEESLEFILNRISQTKDLVKKVKELLKGMGIEL